MLLIPGHDGGAPEPLPSLGSLQVHGGGRQQVTEAWSTEALPPYHSYTHSILRIFAGRAEVEVDGVWAVAEAGSVMLVPGFRQLRRRTAGFDHAWIVYSCTSMAADLRLARLTAPLIHAADAGWDHGLAIAGRIGNRLRQASATDLAAIEAVLLRAVATMLAATGDPGMSPIADDDLVRQAARWLDLHYLERPSLAQVAQAVGCSPNHLHTRFSTILGLSPAAYAEQQRLRDAHHLLAGTALPVQEIARRCGYADPFHFSRVVRRQLGRAPRRLRQGGFTP